MLPGKYLRAVRIKKGITQQQLETELSLSFGHISRIEAGKINPSKETLLKIAQALKFTPEQQNILFGYTNQPATKEEFLEVLPYTKSFVETLRNPAGLSDICGFMWFMNKPMLSLFGLNAIASTTMSQKFQGIHILEWLFNTKLPGYARLDHHSRDNLLLNETILFIFLANYMERKDETWIQNLLKKLQQFPDFPEIWNVALEKAKSSIPLSPMQLTMTYIVNGKPKSFHCNSTHLNKFPRFLIAEFVPIER